MLTIQNSTPLMSLPTMRLTALEPPPPTPTTCAKEGRRVWVSGRIARGVTWTGFLDDVWGMTTRCRGGISCNELSRSRPPRSTASEAHLDGRGVEHLGRRRRRGGRRDEIVRATGRGRGGGHGGASRHLHATRGNAALRARSQASRGGGRRAGDRRGGGHGSHSLSIRVWSRSDRDGRRTRAELWSAASGEIVPRKSHGSDGCRPPSWRNDALQIAKVDGGERWENSPRTLVRRSIRPV